MADTNRNERIRRLIIRIKRIVLTKRGNCFHEMHSVNMAICTKRCSPFAQTQTANLTGTWLTIPSARPGICPMYRNSKDHNVIDFLVFTSTPRWIKTWWVDSLVVNSIELLKEIGSFFLNILWVRVSSQFTETPFVISLIVVVI